LERKFHLPPLGDLKGNVDAINTLVQSVDKEKLKQVTIILQLVIKLQQQSKPGELERVENIIGMLMQITQNVPVGQVVTDVKSVVGSVQAIIKMLPADAFKGFKLEEIAGEIKGMIKESR
jgi:hypothetical protein